MGAWEGEGEGSGRARRVRPRQRSNTNENTVSWREMPPLSGETEPTRYQHRAKQWPDRQTPPTAAHQAQHRPPLSAVRRRPHLPRRPRTVCGVSAPPPRPGSHHPFAFHEPHKRLSRDVAAEGALLAQAVAATTVATRTPPHRTHSLVGPRIAVRTPLFG